MTDEPEEMPQEAEGAEPEVDSNSVESEVDAAVPARLIVKRSNAETDVVFEVSAVCVIGRFDPAVGPVDVDLGTIPEGQYVSRKHAKITLEDGTWKITDLGSSNGTFILRDDFEKVDEADLEDGAELALGNARFVFRHGSL